MTAAVSRTPLSWSARLLIALTLVLVGAAAATWGLARSERAARILGVAPAPPAPETPPQAALGSAGQPPAAAPAMAVPPADARVAELEARLQRVERASQRAEGSVGRADALVIAFAVRRAVERAAPLGYLETLLVDRFGTRQPQAVATVVTFSRDPVRLDQLIAQYEELGPVLRSGGRNEGLWTAFRRELGSLIEVRRADRPTARPDGRYQRALERLSAGDVDTALAETMRLPGADQAGAWVAAARRYIAARRALDQIEASALLSGGLGPR